MKRFATELAHSAVPVLIEAFVVFGFVGMGLVWLAIKAGA